jgi:hypothetical protein
MAKRLDENGTLYLLSKLLILFVKKESGKGLSTNDLTDSLKQMILGQFSGSWNDLTNKPTTVSTWTNDAGYQTALQISTAIANALTASGYQTATQVEALIEQALDTLDTEIFVVVEQLPDPATANPKKIYLCPPTVPGGANANGLEEWIVVNGAWEKLGSMGLSLDGYFNETNLVAITNAEIDAMIASLQP